MEMTNGLGECLYIVINLLTLRSVIRDRVFKLKQLPDTVLYRCLNSRDASTEAAMLSSYFQLSVSLKTLYSEWGHRDPNFAKIAPVRQ
jgi:hypothetical protein